LRKPCPIFFTFLIRALTASVGPLLTRRLPVAVNASNSSGRQASRVRGQPEQLGHVGSGAAVQDAPEPVAGFGLVVAAPVEQLQLLPDDPRLGQLSAAIAAHEGGLQPAPLSLGQGGEVAAQQPPCAVERVVAVPAVAEGLLLPAAPDVVDRG
jgi:hypothetical protein